MGTSGPPPQEFTEHSISQKSNYIASLHVGVPSVHDIQFGSLEPSMSRTLGSRDTLSDDGENDEVFGTRRKNLSKNYYSNNFQNNNKPILSVSDPEGEDCALERLESDNEIIDLGVDDILNIEEEKSFCLLGRFAGRFPGLFVIYQLIKFWKVNCNLEKISNGHVIFWFKNGDDRDKVAAEGPYFVFGKRLFLEYLPDRFELNNEDICVLPVWVRLPGLPKKCWHSKALSKIATRIGKPIFMDRHTKEKKKSDYARVLVDVDCSMKPCDCIQFRLPDGTISSQKIIYEYLPLFCSRCGGDKHVNANCPLNRVEKNLRRREEEQAKEGQASAKGGLEEDEPSSESQDNLNNLVEEGGPEVSSGNNVNESHASEKGESTNIIRISEAGEKKGLSLEGEQMLVEVFGEEHMDNLVTSGMKSNVEKSKYVFDLNEVQNDVAQQVCINEDEPVATTIHQNNENGLANGGISKQKRKKKGIDQTIALKEFFADLEVSPVPSRDKLVAGGGGRRVPTSVDQC